MIYLSIILTVQHLYIVSHAESVDLHRALQNVNVRRV